MFMDVKFSFDILKFISYFWLTIDKTGELRVCGKDEDQCYSFNVTLDEWSNVEVSQHPEGDKYRYEVKVNGVLIGSILNEDAQMFEDVRIYASDPWQMTSEGTIRNISVEMTSEKRGNF